MICSWLLHPGSRWMPNVFIRSEIGSQRQIILGHPQLIECMGWVSVFWAWYMDLSKGVLTIFAYCEKLFWKFFFKYIQQPNSLYFLIALFGLSTNQFEFLKVVQWFKTYTHFCVWKLGPKLKKCLTETRKCGKSDGTIKILKKGLVLI